MPLTFEPIYIPIRYKVDIAMSIFIFTGKEFDTFQYQMAFYGVKTLGCYILQPGKQNDVYISSLIVIGCLSVPHTLLLWEKEYS